MVCWQSGAFRNSSLPTGTGPLVRMGLRFPSPILVNTEELRWTILDENAFPLARMTTGPLDDILEIGDDYMLLRERDEMDVERVAMYRIEGFMKEMR